MPAARLERLRHTESSVNLRRKPRKCETARRMPVRFILIFRLICQPASLRPGGSRA
jgi:hypothetical protein